ncbi:MAG: hypothetical protein WC563_15300 [Brevundimonas sp.]
MSEYCINCEATAGELAATHLVLASKNETIDGLTAALATARDALRIHADLNGELSAALQSTQVERDAAQAVLRDVEWEHTSEFTEDASMCCPICHAMRWGTNGKHEPGCALEAAKGKP